MRRTDFCNDRITRARSPSITFTGFGETHGRLRLCKSAQPAEASATPRRLVPASQVHDFQASGACMLLLARVQHPYLLATSRRVAHAPQVQRAQASGRATRVPSSLQMRNTRKLLRRQDASRALPKQSKTRKLGKGSKRRRSVDVLRSNACWRARHCGRAVPGWCQHLIDDEAGN